MRLPKFISSRLVIPAESESGHHMSNPPSIRASPDSSTEDLPLHNHNHHLHGTNTFHRTHPSHSSGSHFSALQFPTMSSPPAVSSNSHYQNSNHNDHHHSSPHNNNSTSQSNAVFDTLPSSPPSDFELSKAGHLMDSINSNTTNTSTANTLLPSSSSSSTNGGGGGGSASSTDGDHDDDDYNNHGEGADQDEEKDDFDPDSKGLPLSHRPYKDSSAGDKTLKSFRTRARAASIAIPPNPSPTPTHHAVRLMAITKMYSVSCFKTFLRVCRGRLILNRNITVPLWLVLALAVLLWAGLITGVVLLLLGGSLPNGSILPSVSGVPPIREINGKIDRPFVLGCAEPAVDEPRANAVLVVLARNKEYPGVVSSMQSLERHFNRWFNYPYVFLNNEPFNETFKQAVQNATASKVEFGLVDANTWNFPEWANVDEVDEAIAQQGDRAIMYGGMASYHRMCRFYSGAFFHHPLLQDYEWYWRVEPDVKYFCDITYDPFKYMEKHKKVYGFTIVIKELVETVPNLFRHTAGFKQSRNMTSKGMWELFLQKHGAEELGDPMSNSGSVHKNKIKERMDNIKKDKEALAKLQEELPDEAMIGDPSARKFMPAGKELEHTLDNTQKLDIDNYDYFAHDVPAHSHNGETYNMCHFWSNFEIARLDFFRSQEYQDYFEALDKSGGFWQERWGDAPVHSLAAGLFLGPEQVHYFRDIGYRHTTIQHCPANAPERQLPHVPYIPDPNDRKQVEEDEYWANYDPEVTNGVGCRCRCDTDVVEVEGKDGSCLGDWVDLIGGWV